MSQIYRVFLSSTGKDLAGYRQKVFEALQRKPDVKVVRMEDFVAEHGKPKDICDREVGSCDIVVGLIGFCYGASPPRYRLSFTHLEYDVAVAAGIPLLMHIAPDGVAFPANTREADDLYQRVMKFRKKLLKTHTVGQRIAWENQDALASHVAEAVQRKLDELRAAVRPASGLARHEASLRDRLAEIAAEVDAGENERETLLAEKAAVAEKLQNLETSYAKAQETITGLREAAERYGNSLGAEKLEEARRIFADGDFDAADSLFARVEDEGDLEIERTAAAAFQRGKIAEEQVRWADAAEHYAKAARLVPTFAHHRQDWDFAWKLGRYEQALAISKALSETAVLEFGEESHETVTALSCRALSLRDLGRYEEAEPLYRQALEIGKATIGEGHPGYATCLNNLASLLQDMGRHAAAEPLFRQAMEIDAKTIGTAHPDYATHLNNLAGLLQDMGRHDEAEPLFRQAMEISGNTLGTAHPAYATRLNNLALLLQDMGRYDEAGPLYRQALEIGAKTIGTAHPDYAAGLNNLAGLLKEMGRIEEARPLLDEAVAIWRKSLGEDHPTYATGLWWKADFANAGGDWGAARGDYSAAYAVYIRVMGEDHPETKKLANQYARFLRAQFPDDPALAELEAAFGPDIGR